MACIKIDQNIYHGHDFKNYTDIAWRLYFDINNITYYNAYAKKDWRTLVSALEWDNVFMHYPHLIIYKSCPKLFIKITTL